MTINEYLRFTAYGIVYPEFHMHVLQGLRPKVTCKDGFTISVQASNCHYCQPRVSQVYYENKLHSALGNGRVCGANRPRCGAKQPECGKAAAEKLL